MNLVQNRNEQKSPKNPPKIAEKKTKYCRGHVVVLARTERRRGLARLVMLAVLSEEGTWIGTREMGRGLEGERRNRWRETTEG